MSEVLPSSLSYSASKQSLRINRFQVRPTSSDSGGPGATFRFNLPSKSLIDVSSFALAFDVAVTGLLDTGVADYSNVKLPHGHKLFSSVKFYVGGQIASGSLCTNTYDILYNTLVKASCGEDWVNSRLNAHAVELIRSGDDVSILAIRPGAGLGKSACYIVDDFLGLPRGNGTGRSIIDTSLWGEVTVEVTMNNESAFAQYGVGAATGAVALGAMTYAVSNMEAFVNCITQTTPLYIKLLTMLIDQKQGQIRFPYQNFITNVSTGTSNARFQVNTGCLDSIVVAPLTQSYALPHGIVGALTGPNIDALTQLSATRYQYDSSKATTNPAASKGVSMSIQIGTEMFPKIPIVNALHVSDITNNSLFSSSLYSQNLLFADVSGALGANSTYNRAAFLSENFIWIQSFAPDGEGWSTRVLTGIDTANSNLEVVINSSAHPAAGNLFMGALCTSMLVFDCASGSVSVVQ